MSTSLKLSSPPGPLALLADLRARGVALWPDGPTLRYRARVDIVTAEMRAALLTAKPTLVAHLTAEVAWRAAGMLAQLRAAGGLAPVLLAKAHADMPGTCLSCGERLVAVESARCALCNEAARRALALERGRQAPGSDAPVETAPV